jgi:uncharacterized protein YecT (DUF1311 family)
MKITVEGKVKRIAIVAFLLGSSPAFAELCDDPQTQADMNYCAKYSFERADGELNDVYGRLKAGYSQYAEPKAALVKAQRAWVAFRDAECKQDEAAVDGGSAAPMIVLQCNARLTIARTDQLQERLQCKEGDLACVTLGDAAD